MNSDSFEKYISDYGKDVYSFCRYLTGNVDDADDLYQQTFLVAFQKGEIDDGRNPKSYLITIAANIRNNSIRKKLWRSKKANVIYMADEDLVQIEDSAQSVEESVEKKDEAAELRRLVDKLPDKLRIVILMYYMEEMSVDEIALALSIPAGTVKSRMHKAKKLLKERLDYER